MSLKGKRVLVTGADGFIGSHLVEALVREGARVRAFCIYNSTGSRGWLDSSSTNLADTEFVLGDIRDARFVERACEQVDVVFHLAALIAIPYSYTAPESFVDTNVRGTLNVLEAVRRAGCKRLVHTSTSEVYGTPDSLPIKETHPLKAQSPYAATKIAADKLCDAFFASYETPVVIVRPFNTFGPRQSARAVIPTIITQLLRGSKTVELGSITPRRDLTYVSDTCAGFVAAGERDGVLGQTIQLGTGRAVSIKQVFDAACKALNTRAEIVEQRERVRPSASEVQALESDPTLAHTLLKWKAQVPLEEGLRLTAEWMRANLDRYRPGYAV